MFRGSRKHILDWSDRSTFTHEVISLAAPVRCELTASSIWMPHGHMAPTEARLGTFGPRSMPGHQAWPALGGWWLKHLHGANTPNWDVALSCLVEDEPGLILIEAKANEPELSPAGKRRAKQESKHSRMNHEHIANAIDEARQALTPHFPTIAIGHVRHYQLSNRIAFAWKLATLGIPTVLIYVGFLGESGISKGQPFRDDVHWQDKFYSYLRGVCTDSICEMAIQTANARFWILSRSLPALEVSTQPSAGIAQLRPARS